jgi:hypothetical protein
MAIAFNAPLILIQKLEDDNIKAFCSLLPHLSFDIRFDSLEFIGY